MIATSVCERGLLFSAGDEVAFRMWNTVVIGRVKIIDGKVHWLSVTDTDGTEFDMGWYIPKYAWQLMSVTR